MRTICPFYQHNFSAVWASVGKAPDENADNNNNKASKTNICFNGDVVIIVKKFEAHNAPIYKKNNESYG